MLVELRRLFNITSGDYHALKELAPGSVPLVSCGDINHGFIGHFDIPASKRYSNVITVAYNGQPVTAKFRPYEFGAKDDIGILEPRRPTSTLALIYVAAALNAQRWRYSYGRKCFKTKLSEFTVDIPVIAVGRSYRINEERIGGILGDISLDLRPPHSPTRPSNELSGFPGTWVKKRLLDLFELRRGDFHSLDALGSGDHATVSRTTNDNGVVGYFERPDESNIYSPGTITVSTVGGDAFLQVRPFIVTDNVVVLRPRKAMPLETACILVAMINQQKWRYGYGRQCYQEKLSAMMINVPWCGDDLDHCLAKSLVTTQPFWGLLRRTISDQTA